MKSKQQFIFPTISAISILLVLLSRIPFRLCRLFSYLVYTIGAYIKENTVVTNKLYSFNAKGNTLAKSNISKIFYFFVYPKNQNPIN